MTVDIILFALTVCGGILVESTVGFAGGLISIPVLLMVLPAGRPIIGTYVLVMVLARVYLLVEARRHVQPRRAAMLLAGALPGVVLGTWVLSALPAAGIELVVGCVTFTFGLLLCLSVRVPLRRNVPTQVTVGLLSGALGGAVGMSGPPVVLYALAQGWAKDVFRANLLAYFTVLGTAVVVTHACAGMLDTWSLLAAGATVVPAIAVSSVGVFLKGRIPEVWFRRIVLGIVLVVGATAALRQAL